MEINVSLSRKLLDLVSIVKKITRQEFNADGSAKGPTLTQYRMLFEIEKGVCHVGKLSEVFGISQPATSIMVNTLVKEGFVRRVPHPTDRRQIKLHLTAKAIAKMETGYQRAFSKIDEKLAGLSVTRKRAMVKELGELSQLLSGPEKQAHHEQE
jgi:DNA-binding MarR family transcriptional regulator